MGTRGRKSAASLQVALPTAIERTPRQRAPAELNDEETEVWAAVVNTQPADWFTPSTAPVLAQYCRHVVQAKRIAELIEKATSDIDPKTKRPTLTIEDYDRLLKIQERESRAISSLATKMRITQQATTNHRGNKKAVSARRPWEA